MACLWENFTSHTNLACHSERSEESLASLGLSSRGAKRRRNLFGGKTKSKFAIERQVNVENTIGLIFANLR